MIVCRKCGAQNDEQETFCAGCGAFLEWTGERADDAPSTPTRPGPTAGPSRGDSPTLLATTMPAAATSRAGEIACPSCGTPNPPERRFCRRCGQQLRTAGVGASIEARRTGGPFRERLALLDQAYGAWLRRILVIGGALGYVVAGVAAGQRLPQGDWPRSAYPPLAASFALEAAVVVGVAWYVVRLRPLPRLIRRALAAVLLIYAALMLINVSWLAYLVVSGGSP